MLRPVTVSSATPPEAMISSIWSGLVSAPTVATDLRGGAALMLAGLAAQGVTTVCDAGHIARGYERLAQRWNSLGAAIRVSAGEDLPT